MKKIEAMNCSSDQNMFTLFTATAATVTDHEAFSDHDILTFQDAFLTNGVYHITCDSIATGRAFIATMLSSLNYYHTVACLTLNEFHAPLPEEVHSVYHQLLLDGYLDKKGQLNRLEDFIIEEFYHDFLWIEADSTLSDTLWYTQFRQYLHETQLVNELPIIIISYSKETS